MSILVQGSSPAAIPPQLPAPVLLMGFSPVLQHQAMPIPDQHPLLAWGILIHLSVLGSGAQGT